MLGGVLCWTQSLLKQVATPTVDTGYWYELRPIISTIAQGLKPAHVIVDLVSDESFATSYAFFHSRQEEASRVDYIYTITRTNTYPLNVDCYLC